MSILDNPFFWIAIVVIPVGGLIAYKIVTSRRYNRAMLAAMTALGFIPAKIKAVLPKSDRKQVPLLKSTGAAFNRVYKHPDGRLVFEFQYIFGVPGIASVKYWQTVMAFPANSVAADFQLAPATTIDRAAKGLSGSTIKIDGQDEFSRQYWLRSSDAARVGALFNPTVISTLRVSDPAGQLSIEKGGNWLIVYRKATLLPASTIAGVMDQSASLAALLSGR